MFQARFRWRRGPDDGVHPKGSEEQGPLEVLQVRVLHRALRLSVADENKQNCLVRGKAICNQVKPIFFY